MMEKLTVDAEGKIVIPPEVIQKRGLHPGDELTLVESAEGLLVYQGGVHKKTLAWWNRLDDRQRLLAEDYALRDENLSEQERDASWNQEAESIEIEAESDELDLPTN
ncbi:MAG TPA: AbrB/MazE/SpoVT family DNA-binding domain-containing protein [Pyrinomonadaceae bacterium]